MGKSVLISGASTGIGHALSLELDRQGYQVFAGIRTSSDAEVLHRQASPQLITLNLDLTLPYTITAACDEINNKTGGKLFCLINNAGISISGALEFIPIQDFREQLEVNLVGQLALTQACLPLLRRQPGRVIFVSSVGGRIPTPFNGSYAASKAALLAMADSLRMELKPWDVSVSVLILGSVRTPIWEKAARTAGSIVHRVSPEDQALYSDMQKRAGEFYRDIGQRGMPVDKVAKATQRLLEQARPSEYVVVGIYALLAELMLKLLPIRLRDRIVRKQMGLS